MRKGFCCLFVCLLMLHHATVFAQSGSISGRVLDTDGQPVTFASVLLRHFSDSSLVKTELTDDKGAYQIASVANGNYLLEVTLLAYRKYLSGKVVVAGNNTAMPDIALQKSNNTTLKEVAIRAQKPFIEVHPDKLVVNVENSIVDAGGSALDVLQHSPGVTVDQNDNISLKGRSGVNVMINGKIQPISGQELANMLKSMPSNAVESIELITNPSAKYDAAGSAGIINIKLKKDSKSGLNGSVNGTYAQGIYGKANGGFNMNYRNNKFNFFASYNHSEREGFNHLTLQRSFYTNSVFAGAYNQDNNYVYHFHTDIASVGMDYNISSKTTIGFILNGESDFINRTGNNYSIVVDSASQQPSSHFTTQNEAPSFWNSYAANINLRHTFDSSGKVLAVDLDYAGYPSHGTQDYTTIYSTPDPEAILHGDQKGITQIRSFKADYTNPFKNNAKLEAGIKTSFVTADNNLRFFDQTDTGYKADISKTDHFIYNETINAGYINVSKDWTKWSTQLGLRAEQTIAKGSDVTTDSSFTRNYLQLFPSFAVQRHVDKNDDLGITLSRRIDRPSYEQLNPFKYYLDPTTYKTGYPYLNPALSYSAELSYTYKQRFITSLNCVITTNPIVEVIQPSATEDKVTIQTTKNLTTLYYYSASGSYQFQFFKWWSNTTNANVYYSRYTGDIAGTNLNAGKVAFNIYSSNHFILPHNWSAELSGFYQAPEQYGYMQVRQMSMIDIGIQKNLFDKQATIRLNAKDIFWHGYPSAVSYYYDYIESFVARRDTRLVVVSFTYRFGKRTLPQSAKHSGGAEDEKKRVGGQG